MEINSGEMNNAIRKMIDNKDSPYFSFSDKAIPYIGWVWRNVNFNSKKYAFGVMPNTLENTKSSYILGFMENNKWDYPVITSIEEEWIKIKELLIQSIKKPNRHNLQTLDEEIQSLLWGSIYEDK